jgi:hypothetical protein
MRLMTRVLASGAGIAALAGAAPASAQYYPGNGYSNPYGYGAPGPSGGYGYDPYGYGGNGQPYGYGTNSQVVVSQCTNAVQARLNGGYNGYNGYGGYNGYNGAPNGFAPYGYGVGRVLGVSRVEPRSQGGFNVRGVATSGRSANYGSTPNSRVDLVWRCRTDARGAIIDIDVNPAQSNYGYNYAPGNDNYYSPYGYQRY